jgi:hypothetical protein
MAQDSYDNTHSDNRRASIIFLFDSHSRFDPLKGCELLEESNYGEKNPTVIRR